MNKKSYFHDKCVSNYNALTNFGLCLGLAIILGRACKVLCGSLCLALVGRLSFGAGRVELSCGSL